MRFGRSYCHSRESNLWVFTLHSPEPLTLVPALHFKQKSSMQPAMFSTKENLALVAKLLMYLFLLLSKVPISSCDVLYAMNLSILNGLCSGSGTKASVVENLCILSKEMPTSWMGWPWRNARKLSLLTSSMKKDTTAVPLPWACFFLTPFMTQTTLKGAGRQSLSNF